MQFDEAGSHHGETGEQVVGAQKLPEGLHHGGNSATAFHRLFV
jgi:hypothetical protein